MLTHQLSPSAYLLRQQWESEAPKQFKKFRKDERSLQVINALAEMITQAKTNKTIPNLVQL